jgi:hypothetical protein
LGSQQSSLVDNVQQRGGRNRLPQGTQEPSPRGRGNKTTVGWVCQIGSTSAGKERVNSKNNEASTERDVRAIVRMWKGGPLRQMAATKVSGAFIPYAKTINGHHFVGRYVCDGCQQPCGGISLSDVGKMSGNRLSKWLCDSCKACKTRQPRQTTPEQRQAAINRLAAARRDRATSVRIQGKEDVAISKAVVAVTTDVNPAEEVYGAM